MAVQVEQLRAQIGNAHATIEKLQTDLTLARQDISLLQHSGLYGVRAAGDSPVLPMDMDGNGGTVNVRPTEPPFIAGRWAENSPDSGKS